ncbi:alcohol dehydrogenase catalytic domain-containing protein [Streptomyces sp. TX20-6-3]|uniref:alcohol dehydrogenase catalytic domain-containing protein n=1 Tax=Streptomyces sp. TX20-6-3 TaxID=3028705 RepID=UPI0029C0EEE0|nr:alcohol dehydrogenase catalytic domain-containing protein [Streptomyces sp. TX20-6-3]
MLVRVEATGLNRAEALFRAGTYYYPATLPGSRLGYEAAGVVEAVGAEVTAYAPGDPVMAAANFDLGTHGVYAERVVLPEEYLVARPEGVDAVTAAAVWLTYSTAYGGMVLTGGLGAGDHVVITGASSRWGRPPSRRRCGSEPYRWRPRAAGTSGSGSWSSGRRG